MIDVKSTDEENIIGYGKCYFFEWNEEENGRLDMEEIVNEGMVLDGEKLKPNTFIMDRALSPVPQSIVSYGVIKDEDRISYDN